MSVKRIIVVSAAALILVGFTAVGITDAVNKKDQIEFQKVELKSKSTEINELNVKYDKLNEELEKASDEKSTSQEEIQKLQSEKEELEKQKQELNSKLQAKLNSQSNAKVASATTSNGSGGNLEAIVRNAAIKNGLDPDWFWGVAKCESTWNPNAVNYNYFETKNGVRYYPSGLFQHLSNYWPARAAAHGYAGASVFDAEANANVTASMWKSGSHLWECQ